MFNLNTRNYENMVLAESAEFAESNLKADPTLRELCGLCPKPFEIAFLSEFTVLRRYFPGSRHVRRDTRNHENISRWSARIC